MQNNKNELPQTPHEHIPIVCPICGSVNIAFITEYHKCIWLKMINQLILIAIIVILTMNIDKILAGSYEFSAIYVLTVFYLLLSIGIFVEESRTHAKAICRNCGNIWLQD